MKRKTFFAISAIVSFMMFALLFIPWLVSSGTVPGLDEDGNQIFHSFTNYFSIYHNLTTCGESLLLIPFFLCFFCLILCFCVSVLGIYREKNWTYFLAIHLFTASLIFFLVNVFLGFCTSPCY